MNKNLKSKTWLNPVYFPLLSYVRLSKDLKEKGVQQVLCVAVNDAFVMHAWGEYLKALDHVTFAGTPLISHCSMISPHKVLS